MEGGARERLLGEEAEVEEGLGRRLWKENKKLWVVAGPSIFTRFSTFGVTVISQAFVGHIGSTELAAYAVVSTVLMRFANGILVRTHASHPPFSPPPPLPSPLPFLRIPQQDICTLHFFIRGSSTDPLRFFHPSSSSSCVAIGAGWQGMVAFVNIGCYYLIGIPLGVVLGYCFDLHVKVLLAKDRLSKWYTHKSRKPNDAHGSA
ncbi:hypothetical protein BHM03_00028609 [Ensete ventricosum]|nr:hypothetical protein BHM03_00028609 [Ensete ventricosum]